MRKVVVELDEDDYVFLNDVSLILNSSISEVIKLTIGVSLNERRKRKSLL